MTRYLSLDMGAESGRLVIVDIGTVDIGTVDIGTADIGNGISTEVLYRYETPITQDDHGRRCWDFPKIIEEVTHALTLAAPHGPFESLGVDTWGLDFGLLDENKELVTLPVTHRDHRTDGYLAKASAMVGRDRLHFETGAQLLEINSIFQLLSIVENSPEELERAKYFQLMPDLVLAALTGNVGTEYTIASTTGLYDTLQNQWALSLAKDLGIPTHIFGDVEDAGTVRGYLKEELQKKTGLGPLKCVATTSHDTAAAVVATPLEFPGSAYISSGTWSLMGVEIDTAVTNETTLDERLTNEGGFDRSIRLLRNITGLWIIQEVRRDLKSQGIDISYVDLVELAKKEGNPWRTLFYVDAPIFVYAGSMISRIQDYAHQTGQPIPETPGELAQATFASLALAYARTADVLADLSGEQMPTIHIVGGGAQNAHLSQMTADISGREVVTGPIEATAIGNALVQAIASGDVKDIGSARKLVTESNLQLGRYQPKISSAEQSEISEVRNRYAQLTVLEER